MKVVLKFRRLLLTVAARTPSHNFIKIRHETFSTQMTFFYFKHNGLEVNISLHESDKVSLIICWLWCGITAQLDVVLIPTAIRESTFDKICRFTVTQLCRCPVESKQFLQGRAFQELHNCACVIKYKFSVNEPEVTQGANLTVERPHLLPVIITIRLLVTSLSHTSSSPTFHICGTTCTKSKLHIV